MAGKMAVDPRAGKMAVDPMALILGPTSKAYRIWLDIHYPKADELEQLGKALSADEKKLAVSAAKMFAKHSDPFAHLIPWLNPQPEPPIYLDPKIATKYSEALLNAI